MSTVDGVAMTPLAPFAAGLDLVVTPGSQPQVDFRLGAQIGAAATLTSSTTEGDLSADPNVARWTPIEISFTVPTGFLVAIVVQIGEDSALWMSAYDEAIAGDESGPIQGAAALAPLFADKSVITIVGTIVAGRTFTASILPNGGWQREQVRLVPYIAKEVS